MDGNKVFIIAEAGVNHNGSLDIARKLIDAAVAAGADAVKFQTFKAAELLSKNAIKADYQIRNTTNANETQDQILIKMHALNLLHLPIVDDNNRVIGLETFESLFTKNARDNWVIFMAGGMGKRLHPLTLDCPKPLLKIGNKPISEILLENFIQSGFKNYIFSINYKSEMIREYYGSGERWGVNIKYIQEDDELGTAGSLSLLSIMPDKPFFVINADVLTNVNFGHILDFHQENV